MIGFFTIIKIWFAKAHASKSRHFAAVVALTKLPASITIIFFICHFGLFILGYFALLDDALGLPMPFSADVIAACLVFFASHVFSLLYHFFYRREYQVVTAGAMMMQPYIRLIPMHISILLVISIMTSPTSRGFAIALLILKPLVDAMTHVAVHVGLGLGLGRVD
ncbi:MAG: hypothetical protein ACI9B8_003298 [Sulfitobacter sp.]